MKKVYIKFVAAVVVAAVAINLIGCGSGRKAKEGELSGTISLSGAFALYPLVVKWAEDFQQMHPGVKIDVSAGGAGKGMTDALSDMVDIGMVSREINPAEADKGAVGFAVAKDAVVATINAKNPALDKILKRGLTPEAAAAIWVSGNAKTWGDILGDGSKTPLRAYTRSDACGAAETWAKWFDSKQEDLGGTAVFGDPGIAAAIQKDEYAIGFNNIGYAYDEQTKKANPGIIVVPIDVDGNGVVDPQEMFYDDKDQLVQAIADGKYPSPPARDLYLVTKSVPDSPVLKAFLEYILTDGQKDNVPAGYIAMPQEKLERDLSTLNAGK